MRKIHGYTNAHGDPPRLFRYDRRGDHPRARARGRAKLFGRVNRSDRIKIDAGRSYLERLEFLQGWALGGGGEDRCGLASSAGNGYRRYY